MAQDASADPQAEIARLKEVRPSILPGAAALIAFLTCRVCVPGCLFVFPCWRIRGWVALLQALAAAEQARKQSDDSMSGILQQLKVLLPRVCLPCHCPWHVP